MERLAAKSIAASKPRFHQNLRQEIELPSMSEIVSQFTYSMMVAILSPIARFGHGVVLNESLKFSSFNER